MRQGLEDIAMGDSGGDGSGSSSKLMLKYRLPGGVRRRSIEWRFAYGFAATDGRFGRSVIRLPTADLPNGANALRCVAQLLGRSKAAHKYHVPSKNGALAIAGQACASLCFVESNPHGWLPLCIVRPTG